MDAEVVWDTNLRKMSVDDFEVYLGKSKEPWCHQSLLEQEPAEPVCNTPETLRLKPFH